jgi:hypothetical protein
MVLQNFVTGSMIFHAIYAYDCHVSQSQYIIATIQSKPLKLCISGTEKGLTLCTENSSLRGSISISVHRT